MFDERGMLTHWLHTSRDITERRLLEAEQRRLNHQREILAPIGELARRAVVDSVGEVLAHLDESIARFADLLGCDVMFVHLLDGEQLRTAAWWSREGAAGDDGPHHDNTVAGLDEARRWSTTVDAVLDWLRLVDEHHSIVAPPAGAWSAELSEMLGGHALSSPLFAGVTMNGVLLGVLGASRPEHSRGWSEDEVAAVEELANVIANLLQRQNTETALHNDMRAEATRAAYERLQMEIAEWALTLEAWPIADGLEAHLQHIGELLGVDSVTLATVEADDDGLRRTARWPRTSEAPIGERPRLNYTELLDKLPDLEPLVVHDVLATDEWFTRQWREDLDAPRAVLIVPLGASGHLDGVLAVTSDRRPRPWADGEINFIRSIAATISSVIGRRRMETSLRLSQARLEAMLDGSSDFILVINDQGVIQYANLAVRRVLERTIEDLVGRPGFELIHLDDRALAVERFATLMRGDPNENTRVRALRSDGTVAGWWEIMSGAQRDPLIGGTILTCRDITGRVAAEQARDDTHAAPAPDVRSRPAGPGHRAGRVHRPARRGVRRHRPEHRRRHGPRRPVRRQPRGARRARVTPSRVRNGAGRTCPTRCCPTGCERLRDPEPIHVESVRRVRRAVGRRMARADRFRRRVDGGDDDGRRSARRLAGGGPAQWAGRSGTTRRSDSCG